jgi:hypothetical protein
MDAGSIAGAIFMYILLAAAGIAVTYAVIYYAVLNALRTHTMSSTTAVSVTSAVPLRTISPLDESAGTDS